MEGTVTISIEQYEECKSLKRVFDEKYKYVKIEERWISTGSHSSKLISEGYYTSIEEDKVIQRLNNELSLERQTNDILQKEKDDLFRRVYFLELNAKRRYWFGGLFKN